MQTVYTEVDRRTFTYFDNLFFHLFGHFRNHFFDTRGVNTTVLHQLMQGQASYLTTHGVESRKSDRFWGIVYDDLHTGSSFERTDITSFTTDDTTFHFVILDMEHTDTILNGRLVATR